MKELKVLDFLKKPELLGRNFRFVATEVSSREFAEGYVMFCISYVAVDSVSLESYLFEEEITGIKNCPHSVDFFEFLRTAKVGFEDYFELTGLVFDAKLVLDSNFGKFFLVIGDRRLVALPPKE